MGEIENMGQDRFKAEKIIMQRSQVNGCPVVPVKTTLYKDTVGERKVFTNEFRSNYDGNVDEISVKITCFNEKAEIIGIIKDYKYSNLNVKLGEEFGGKKYIACPDNTISSFTIIVTNVILENGYYWSEENGKIKNINDPAEEEAIPVEMAIPVEEDVTLPETEDVNFFAEQPLSHVMPGSVEENNVQEETPVPVAEKVENTVSIQTPTTDKTVQDKENDSQKDVVKEEKVEEKSDKESLENVTASVTESDASTEAEADNTKGKKKKTKKVKEKKVKEPKEKKPMPKWLKFLRTLIIVAVLLVVAYLALDQWNKYSDYNRGVAYMAQGNYEYAVTVYSRLGDYKDSPANLKQAQIQYADSLISQGDFNKAIETYKIIGGYDEQIVNAYELWLASLVEEGKADEAYELLTNCQVEVEANLEKSVYYCKGKALHDSKSYEEAIQFFALAGSYEDSKTMISECNYNMAVAALEISDFDKAITFFEEAGNYKDSKDLIEVTKYEKAKNSIVSRNFDVALELLEDIADYEDSAELLLECYYVMGQNSFVNNDFEAAMNYYKLAGEYEDAPQLYNEALYQYLIMAMREEVTMNTMELLDELPSDYEDIASIKKILNRFVEHVGAYEWSASNDKEINELGGIEDHVVVTLSYDNGEVEFNVDGHPVDQKRFVYNSGSNSDTYTMLNTTTITRTLNGKVHTYKKIVE